MTFRIVLLCIACCVVVGGYSTATPEYEQEQIHAVMLTGEPVVERAAAVLTPDEQLSLDDEQCGQATQKVAFKPLVLRVKRRRK